MQTAVFSTPSVFLVPQRHTAMPMGMAVPAAFPGIKLSSSSLRVASATTSLCGTIVTSLILDSQSFLEYHFGERASPAYQSLDPEKKMWSHLQYLHTKSSYSNQAQAKIA